MKKLYFKKNIEIFIFSRANSSRLKNKYRLKIGNLSLIEIIVIRLLNVFDSRMIKVCVPTKDKKKYQSLLNKYNILIISGPENDLIKRILINISSQKAIVRVTADDPLTSPVLIKKFINIFLKYKYDYIYTKDYPDGLIPELVSVRYLRKIYSLLNNKEYSNYLSYFLIRNIYGFKKFLFTSKYNELSKYSLTVDYKKEFFVLKKMFEYFKYDYLVSTKKILLYIKKNKNYLSKLKIKKFISLKTKRYDVSLKGDEINRLYL